MGTHLEQYLHKIVECGYKNMRMLYFPFHHKDNDPEITNFYLTLPLQCTLTKEEMLLANSLPSWTWNIKWVHQPIEWEDNQDAYVTYHALVRSVGQRIVRNALEKIGYKKEVSYPVIHYRLGDVPFVRNMGHHINKYAYFLWALEKAGVSDWEDKTVLIVSSNKHHANTLLKTASDYYLQDFLSFLQEHGYNPIVQSESVLEDFATMVYAPILISSGSSYSFMAGMATTGTFLSSSVGREDKIDHSFITNTNCEWMCPFSPVLHGDVVNYFDLNVVFKQLREPFKY